MDISDISEIVKYHRKVSKLSREVLAKIAGVGKTAVYDIENGKSTVQFSTLQKVLDVLNIKIEIQSKLMESYNQLRRKEKDIEKS